MSILDDMFDRADAVINAMVPDGRPGFILELTGTPERPYRVWHFALNRMATVCGITEVDWDKFKQDVEGGIVLFCALCLRETVENFKQLQEADED